MAYNIQQINPIDFQPSVAVGVSIPFSAGNVFNSTYTTQDALKSNLINFLLTNRGERFLNPNFGADIRALLFEQMVTSNTDDVQSAIEVGIANYFPEVALLNVYIDQSPDTNTVTVYLKYRVKQTNVQDQLAINFQQ